MEPPTFKHLRPDEFNKLDEKQLESIENLTRFHIDSFDWVIDQGNVFHFYNI
jgi:hypothetical protein